MWPFSPVKTHIKINLYLICFPIDCSLSFIMRFITSVPNSISLPLSFEDKENFLPVRVMFYLWVLFIFFLTWPSTPCTWQHNRYSNITYTCSLLYLKLNQPFNNALVRAFHYTNQYFVSIKTPFLKKKIDLQNTILSSFPP